MINPKKDKMTSVYVEIFKPLDNTLKIDSPKTIKPKKTKKTKKTKKPKKNKKTKKTKKKSFRRLMRDAMKSKKTDKEIREIHQNKIKEFVGGGNFRKIDKI